MRNAVSDVRNDKRDAGEDETRAESKEEEEIADAECDWRSAIGVIWYIHRPIIAEPLSLSRLLSFARETNVRGANVAKKKRVSRQRAPWSSGFGIFRANGLLFIYTENEISQKYGSRIRQVHGQ